MMLLVSDSTTIYVALGYKSLAIVLSLVYTCAVGGFKLCSILV